MNNSDRLDRIEALTESNAQAISELRIGLADIRTGLADVKAATENLVSVANIHQQNFEIIATEIRDMQAEIRGLQIENRRIFERLFPDENQE